MVIYHTSNMSLMSQKITSSVVLIATAFVLVLGGSNILMSSSAASSNTRVAAGGNGSAWDTYSPQSVEIKAGDSVTWYNPSPVPEPHTTTFLTDPSYFPPLAAPFSIPSNTETISILPTPNIEPIVVPPGPTDTNESKIVIMDNARAYNPVVVDNAGKNVTYLQPNSNYTLSGTETYVNSGWMFPEGQLPPDFPPIEEFTVTFENPGTYGYTCVLHPWMTGTVEVT
jgi:plastocyanin